ncbi:MAG: right-handed parallel beta-helix repeat-containing protein [Planctomycetota bacterium]|nr:right-handed parallel beta-helix repeat-containing protein [Planctomycetota bacterium]
MFQSHLLRGILAVSVIFAFVAPSELFAQGNDWYVSAARGKGKSGTKEKPAKDLSGLIKKIEAGDTVHIAEGIYLGSKKGGWDEILVPVKIIGGYSDDFTKRDPWGAHRTIFSGDNKGKNFKSRARLRIKCQKFRDKGDWEILVDGIIFDSGARNQYTGEGDLKIKRRFTAKTGANATPDFPGLWIEMPPKFAKVTIQNCIAMNCAPNTMTGAFNVKAMAGNKVYIRNNLAVNNTGCGISCLTAWRSDKDRPEFFVENNTILFTWKYDGMSSQSGRGLHVEPGVPVVAKNNVFAFSDFAGVANLNGQDFTNLTLVENLFCGNLTSDYFEFDAAIALEDIEDDAEKLGDDTTDNVTEMITVPVSPAWSKLYATRVVFDRNAAEESIQPKDTWENKVKQMLGLPQDGGTLNIKSDIWLHRLSLEDALKIANSGKVKGMYGCDPTPVK